MSPGEGDGVEINMKKNDIINYIINRLEKNTELNEKSNIICTSTKMSELVLDSLSFIELVVDLEMEFGIEFEDSMLQLGAFEAINDIVEYVYKKIKD